MEESVQVLNQAAVVIPVYKELAEASEKRSFWQCSEVLKDYPIVLVVPESMNTSYYEALIDHPVFIERFPDVYFQDVISYSKLLLSRLFYERFLLYEYILLYQLDAWVFRDELQFWAGKGYDYIGAPWLDAPPMENKKRPLVNLSKRLVNKVGNGGLSLRRVSSHIRWAPWASFVFRWLPKNEDLIWTLFVPFYKPTVAEALRFAFERLPQKSYERTSHHLPFGCHAWQKYQPDFWKAFIDHS